MAVGSSRGPRSKIGLSSVLRSVAIRQSNSPSLGPGRCWRRPTWYAARLRRCSIMAANAERTRTSPSCWLRRRRGRRLTRQCRRSAGFPAWENEIERKWREVRLYQIAPILKSWRGRPARAGGCRGRIEVVSIAVAALGPSQRRYHIGRSDQKTADRSYGSCNHGGFIRRLTGAAEWIAVGVDHSTPLSLPNTWDAALAGVQQAIHELVTDHGKA
jgi:hypothetical protein